MNIKKVIKIGTIGLLSLITLSSIEYNPINCPIHAKHIRHFRYISRHKRYHHKRYNHMSKSQYVYRLLIKFACLEHYYPSRFHKKILNKVFRRNKRYFSIAKLVNLQRYFHIYHSLSIQNKKYYHTLFTKIKYKHALNKVNKQDSRFDTRLRLDMIREINKTRHHYHLRPLKITVIMQKAANYRNPKVLFAYEHPLDCRRYEHVSLSKLQKENGTTDKWIHGYDTHTSGDQYLAHHHYRPHYWGENATDWFYTKYCTNNDGTLDKYPDTTPWNVAYDVNNDLMNHDMANGNNNGHRHNELNRYYKYMGVGVNYNSKARMGSINEQFAS